MRLEALEEHYPWIDPAGLEYFRARLHQAPRDAQYALDLVVERCRTRETQERAVAALSFKCDLLWAQLEAIDRGDTRPGAPLTEHDARRQPQLADGRPPALGQGARAARAALSRRARSR